MASILKMVEHHSRDLLLLVVGFDGVLAEYQVDPEAVFLTDSRRQLLRHLVDKPGVVLAVTSGRRVSDLQNRIGLGDEVFYVGLHGLEVVGPGFLRVQQQIVDQYRDQFHEIAAALERSIRTVPGIRLEEKDAAIALHTREAGPADARWARFQLLTHASDLINDDVARVFRGNQVFELLPNVGHLRADTIRSIRALLKQRGQRSVFSIYVGEDVIDDDAVEAIDDDGIVAVVGRRGAHRDVRLDSTEAVEHLIAGLARIRSGAAGA